MLGKSLVYQWLGLKTHSLFPRPPQTCQRLTTNRPIESAPDKRCSLIQQFSAGALTIGISRYTSTEIDSILINMKAFAWCAGFILLLSTIPAVAELRAPAKVALDLGTEIRRGERQAVLLLSAEIGTACAGTASDLKTMAKFDERSAVIEILGYDFTPAPDWTDRPCPTALSEA